MNKKILLIEDEVNVVGFIKKGLTEEGFEVSVALDGNSGVNMAVKNNYDLMGNLNELQHMGDSNFTRIYYHTNNLLDAFEVDGQTYHYQYDVCGNQIQENEERHMQWDYADKLRLYYNQTSSGSEPSVYTHYLYDAGGNRVKKYTRTAGGNWETITYIDGIIEYREDQDSNIQSISHVMDTSTSSVQAKRIATIREGSDFGDTTPAIKYNLDDHLGSSNVLVDENGTLVNFEEYYPFGETSFGAYAKKRYRFCGKEKDSESGMYYYGARYYSPWLCRFTSVDPKAGKYVFQTSYAYADNNPINKMDYNGEGTEEGGNGISSNSSSSSTKSEASDNIGTPPKTIDELVTIPNKPVKPEKVHKADYINEDGKLDKETYNKAKENYKHEMNGYKQRLADYKFLSSVKNDLINPGSNTDLLKTRDAILKAQVPVYLKVGKVTDPSHAAETGTLVENNKVTLITITFDMEKIYESKPTDASNKFNVDQKLTTYVDPNNIEKGVNNPQHPVLRTPNRFNIQMHEFGHVYFNLTNPYSEAGSEKQAQQFEYNSYY